MNKERLAMRLVELERQMRLGRDRARRAGRIAEAYEYAAAQRMIHELRLELSE